MAEVMTMYGVRSTLHALGPAPELSWWQGEGKFGATETARRFSTAAAAKEAWRRQRDVSMTLAIFPEFIRFGSPPPEARPSKQR